MSYPNEKLVRLIFLGGGSIILTCTGIILMVVGAK